MLKNLLILVLLFVAQLAHAGENLFENNYQPQKNGGLQSQMVNPDTKMYVSNHKDEDNINMLEDGYDLMGTSDFEAGNIAPEQALQHAKNIKADAVLVYSKYASKQMELSKIQAIKQAAKTTHEVDESVLKQDETQYKYFASYWAKMPMPLLGLHVIKLKPVDAEPENGLKVLAVIKDSPAAKANLQRGDVLLKIGEIAVQKPEELAIAVLKYQGKAVEIGYERDGQPASTQATLNSR